MNETTIVITDGFTLNPGDLTWDELSDLGNIINYDRTAHHELLERCRNADVIVTNKTSITGEVIEQATKLKLIAVTATGFNIVDTDAARKKNISVCNVPEYGTYSVAQHAMAMMLELTNHVGVNAMSVATGEWSSSPDFSYSKKPIIELLGKTLGIIGMGKIGQQLGIIAQALGMKVIYTSRSLKLGWPAKVTLDELFQRSDFVSVHCPQTKDNVGFINAHLLNQMKPTAYLINTSRGALVNEGDLALALRERRLAGAALDVLSSEPPPDDHPLIGTPNCLITPHNAWLSKEARERIMKITIENVKLGLLGTPQNVVN